MFVLDASVLAKAFLEEDGSKEFRAWLARETAKGTPLYAPHLAYSEVGRIIQKECRDLKVAEAKELHQAVFIGISIIPLDPSDSLVWDAAKHLTYYDAEYVDAARVTDGILVSADDKQLQAAAKIGIKGLSFSPSKAKTKHAEAA
ncbi:MAG: type II toxin-antitoxin system VapC family toxin [Candidatus Thermoplasmatota archaeon]